MYMLTEEQQKILGDIQKIVEENIAPHALNVDENAEFPERSLGALAESGYFGLTIPVELGGMGQDLRTMAAVLEKIAEGCASTALCYLVHLGGVAAYSSSEPRKDDLLRTSAAGEHLSTLALGEFGSRSHFWAPMSVETRSNGKVVLDASKAFVTSAGHADGYVVITRAGSGENPTETTFYYVDAAETGLIVQDQWDALGMRGNASAPMRFKEIEVAAQDALTESGRGMDLLLSTLLPLMNIGLAAICLGIAESAYSIVRKHLLRSKLEHLGMRLADIPVERARLARMRVMIDQARTHLVASLDALESGDETSTLMVLESKVVGSEMVLEVTDLAMKAMGGTAFNRALGLERRFRDARAADVTGVTGDLLLDFIGRAQLDMPLM